MPTEVHRHDVQRLVAQGAQLVDVMPAAEFAESHISGAVNIALADLPDGAPQGLDRRHPVIVYCYDSL